MAAKDELLSKLLKTPSLSPTLEETLDFINRNAPKWGADAHRLGREGLNKQFMVKIGDKAYNLAPEASRWVQMPDGKIVPWPKGEKALADLKNVKGAKLLNLTPEKIESLLPPPPKPLAPEVPPPSAQSQTAGRLAATEEQMTAEAEKIAQREVIEARMAAERQAEIDRANAWKNAGADEARRIERIMGQTQTAPAAAAESVHPFMAEQAAASELPPAVQLAKQKLAASGAAASAERPRGPWDAPPPPPTSVPSARPAPYDPLKEKFPLSTEAQLWAAPVVAGGAAEIFRRQAGQGTMFPSQEEMLQRKMEAAVRAGQPSEDLSPSESSVDAALKIARERALESAYSRDDQNRMLSDQDAWRSMEGEPGYTTPGAATQWEKAGVNMGAQPVTGAGLSPQMTPRTAANIDATSRTVSRPSTAPATRPAASATSTAQAPSPISSFFSPLKNFFGNTYDYDKMSSKQLYELAQQNPDNRYAELLAAKRAGDEYRAAQPSSDEGKKRGGSVGGMNGKDAALHKALDIIHSMMMRGRH